MINYNLSRAELTEITALGYVIREHWISPVERWEFTVYAIGDDKPLAFRKSPRAAYNFIIKELKEMHP